MIWLHTRVWIPNPMYNGLTALLYTSVYVFTTHKGVWELVELQNNKKRGVEIQVCVGSSVYSSVCFKKSANDHCVP